MFNGSTFYQTHKKKLKVVLAAFGLCLISLIVYSPYIPTDVGLKVGDVANQTVSAPSYFEFQTNEDLLKTQQLRKSRGELVEKVYTINKNINREVEESIVKTFTTIKSLANPKNTPPLPKHPKLPPRRPTPKPH